ncbi:S1 RNA-binding domain-containing protein [bacterium]|nr:S1 RNA-binding domain-containing protein [bacterium]
MTQQIELDEFERLLEESFAKVASVADVVRGAVVKREKDGFLVDIGSKKEAFLPDKEISNFQDKDPEELVKVGEVKEFFIMKDADDDDKDIIISLKKVACAQAWQDLQEAKLTNLTILAKVNSIVKGGIIVEVKELRGFIPASQLRNGAPFDGLLNQEIEVKVLEADPKKNKLILSQRQVFTEQREQVVDDILKDLAEDQIVEGEIVRITDFGAFIDINGVDGLLPISEISWQRIKHPSDLLSLGQKLEVKILKIDTDLKRISLSLKRMGSNPWEEIEGKFEEGQVITGTINKVATFGLFVNIYPGVEALLPVAEISDNKINLFETYSVGDEIKVMVKKFTPKEHRIALSIKDIQA